MNTSLESSTLKKWATWQDCETDYALTKFPDIDQSAYLRKGLTRGDFNFNVSIMNYLVRAKIRAEQNVFDLRYTQNVLKAAHNAMALCATGLMVYASSSSTRAGHREARDLVVVPLAQSNMYDGLVNQATIEALRPEFNRLQTLQDAIAEGDTSTSFISGLVELATPLQLTAISASEIYGWPRPGLSSTANVEPWDYNE